MTNSVKKTLGTEGNVYPKLLISKYMGSKKAILGFVADQLTALTKPGDIIIDLMAGTHTIGFAMKHRCQIVANDIQRYSRVIGETLLNYVPEYRFNDTYAGPFKLFFMQNLRACSELFEAGIRSEHELIGSDKRKTVDWLEYREFCDDYPYFMRTSEYSIWQNDFTMLFQQKRVEAFRTFNKLEPYSLFSLYFANTYLGVRQAAEVDSVRYAIDKLCDQWLPDQSELEIDPYSLRCMLISVLISVINRINPGPGHWAAYPHPNESNLKQILYQRRLSVWDLFLEKVSAIEASLAANTSEHAPHIVMTEDYVNFMDEVKEYIRHARVVYLDPPYSQGHYSRFYHLIETLTIYDYPEIEHKGRYRGDRHQSPFAHKTQAAKAVGSVCEIARECGADLVISYSHGGIIENDEVFRAILEAYYPPEKINLKKLSAEHSKLGQSQRMKTEEYLFTCKS